MGIDVRSAKKLLTGVSLALLALFLPAVPAYADNAAFDLAGPRIDMKVSRGGKSLPIAEVPNLQPGDRLWIHPDFPENQSARYLLVVAFLRGSTNPPPDSWFTRVETWKKQVREEGFVLTVPRDAQQVLLFLAPETSGDFSTLRSAVRDKPGVFVRASQDLNQASLDRTRLEKYLSDVRQISDTDPKALHDRSVLLARTLGIRLDQQCFERPLEQQASCLTQNTGNLVLDDGHSQSMVAALASGPNSELIGAVSATPLAGGGFYSAYVGAIVDLARVMGNMRTASFQYIPALVSPKKEQMNLRLNNPPSFRKPMSVIVVGLPAVEAPQLPPLRTLDAKQVYCLQKSPLVLPVEGAPLVFSSDIAHNFVLHVQGKGGNAQDLPAWPEAASGGFVVDTHSVDPANLDPDVVGTLRGAWGFEKFDGPNFHLVTSRTAQWKISSSDESALIVGREDVLHLQAASAVCVDDVSLQDAQGRDIKTTWKVAKPEELEIKVLLRDEAAGALKLKVHESGQDHADQLLVQAYSEAAHLEGFMINAGDPRGILTGSRLDEVQLLEVKGARFVPAKLTRANEQDELRVAASDANPPALHPKEHLVAHVALKDGRILELPTVVQNPRPKVSLVSKSIRPGPAPTAISLGSQDELPLDGQISFLLKTEIPAKFSHDEKIEVASVDESFSAMLNFSDGSLVLRDSEDLVATVDPRKAFGSSAFGPLQFRPVDPEGGKGDWQPLAVLVRLPTLREIRCSVSLDKPCQLSGNNLYLIDSVAADPQFTHIAPVPSDFLDSTLAVPHPSETGLYVKLRDDPSAVSTATLPVTPEE